MQETKRTKTFAVSLFGHKIISFSFTVVTHKAPVGVMTEIIDKVARKLHVGIEVIDEG